MSGFATDSSRSESGNRLTSYNADSKSEFFLTERAKTRSGRLTLGRKILSFRRMTHKAKRAAPKGDPLHPSASEFAVLLPEKFDLSKDPAYGAIGLDLPPVMREQVCCSAGCECHSAFHTEAP
jgi:hypothetical protein